MSRARRWIPLLVVLVVFYLQYQRSPTAPTAEDSRSTGVSDERTKEAPSIAETGSGSQVAVDEEHIFTGEINRRGRPVGFHARPGGRDPQGARVVRILDSPNGQGVYTARVEIYDPSSGEWLEKRSSFFPDSLDHDEVLAVIQQAFASRDLQYGDRWQGPSGTGFVVEGYLLGDHINTAYPLYR